MGGFSVCNIFIDKLVCFNFYDEIFFLFNAVDKLISFSFKGHNLRSIFSFLVSIMVIMDVFTDFVKFRVTSELPKLEFLVK